MVQELFCTLPTEKDVDAAVRRMKAEGLKLRDIVVATQPDDVDRIAHPAIEMNQSLKRGILGGAGLGFLVGLMLVLYSNSASFTASEGILSIPLVFAGGWAIYGAIVGATGILSRKVLSANLQAHFEEQVGCGKILMAIRLHNRKDLDHCFAALYELGASDLHQSGSAAA